MSTSSLWKKVLINRAPEKSTIAICVRKIGEFSQSRNDRDVMGSRARSYLRLEVVVGGGRRAEEGSAERKVNAVETWYSRGARQEGRRRRWDYDEIRGRVAGVAMRKIQKSLSATSYFPLNIQAQLSEKGEKRNGKEDTCEKYMKTILRCTSPRRRSYDGWSIVMMRHTTFSLSSIVIASIIDTPRYVGGEILSCYQRDNYTPRCAYEARKTESYTSGSFYIRHDLERCWRKYHVHGRRFHPWFCIVVCTLDSRTATRTRARNPSRVATPRERPVPRIL